jgi:hypothetical protein
MRWACPGRWDEAPHYLIRDRDRINGSVVTLRLHARLIGSIRRECVDHIIVLSEVRKG